MKRFGSRGLAPPRPAKKGQLEIHPDPRVLLRSD